VGEPAPDKTVKMLMRSAAYLLLFGSHKNLFAVGRGATEQKAYNYFEVSKQFGKSESCDEIRWYHDIVRPNNGDEFFLS